MLMKHTSSIAKKQVVALTGLMLIGFVVAHLAGNLFIYGGPEAFNGYAHKLEGLRPVLNVLEFGLGFIFLVHISFTYMLVHENIRAKGGVKRYAVDKPVGDRSLATRLMAFSGFGVFAFVIWHLFDFTFADKTGPRSLIEGGHYGLYGIVYNSFHDPVHSLLYIAAMCCVGLHLSHGVQSFVQTFGFKRPCLIKKVSDWFALLITCAYCSIPVYVLMLP